MIRSRSRSRRAPQHAVELFDGCSDDDLMRWGQTLAEDDRHHLDGRSFAAAPATDEREPAERR